MAFASARQVGADRGLSGLLGQRVALVGLTRGSSEVAAHALHLGREHEHVGERSLVAHLEGSPAEPLERVAGALEVVPPKPDACDLEQGLGNCAAVPASRLELQSGAQGRAGLSATERRLGQQAAAQSLCSDGYLP